VGANLLADHGRYGARPTVLLMVAAVQTTCDYSFDDSKLGRVKELVADLHAKLDVAARLVDAEGSFHDQIPLDKEAPEDIVTQVTEYFSQPNQPAPEELAVDN
jgi:hypothetical protein